MSNQITASIVRSLTTVAGAGAALYAAYVAVTWVRYGHASRRADAADPLLDRFIPIYDVVERHGIRVAAPPSVTLDAATRIDLWGSPLARSIFRAREIIMGSRRVARPASTGLIAETRAMGWGVLAERPGREIVMGAVTQPWLADVVFRPLAPEAFAGFDHPGFVKIVWTLRAEPLPDGGSMFRTETRVVATDAESRARFRRYWSLLSPGIILIRWLLLTPLKTDAERRARPGAVAAARQAARPS